MILLVKKITQEDEERLEFFSYKLKLKKNVIIFLGNFDMVLVIWKYYFFRF